MARIFGKSLVSFVGVLAMVKILLGQFESRSALLGIKNAIDVIQRDTSNLNVARMVPR